MDHDDIDGENELRRYIRRAARAVAHGEGELADDVEQHVHLALLQKVGDSPNDVRAWIRTAAANYVRLQGRIRLRRPKHEPLAHDAEAASGEPIEKILQREESSILLVRLGEMDSRHAEVLVLRFMEELPPRVVARRLNVPVNTVRSRTQRALDALRRIYKRGSGRADRRPGWVLPTHEQAVARPLSPVHYLFIAALLMGVASAPPSCACAPGDSMQREESPAPATPLHTLALLSAPVSVSPGTYVAAPIQGTRFDSSESAVDPSLSRTRPEQKFDAHRPLRGGVPACDLVGGCVPLRAPARARVSGQ